MATAGRQGSSKKQPAAGDQEFDPKYEWQENDKSFILRIHLSGFRKQDFRVQVDGTGRLTVRGQRADAETNGKQSRFSKVFQLPSTSNLDAISGRFEAGVLTLTVPKRPPPPPATVEDIINTQQPAKQQDQAAKAPAGDAKPPPQEQRKAEEDDAKPKAAAEQKPEQEQPKAAAAPPAVPVRKEEEGKPKADDAAAAPVAATESKQATPPTAAAAPVVATDDSKQATPTAAGDAAAAAPVVATDGSKLQATPKAETPPERKAVDPESLAERVKRRAEEEKAPTLAEEAGERQRKKACRGFKERVTEELQGLAASEWAEGLVDTVKKNKEVIATAVAAFSLGLLVSTRLFSRSRN